MDEPIRVLHVVTHMNRGGLESMIMNYYRNIDRSKVQFDFLTHRPENEKKDFDDEIYSLGGKIYHISTLNPFSHSYLRELDCFFKTHREYKIIHVHQDCLSGVILKIAKKNRVPVRIAHCHSSSQDKGVKYYIKEYYKRSIKKYATQMFACGKKAGKWMFGCDDFIVIPNAIDADKYKFNVSIREAMRCQLGIGEKCFVLGHVGRFCTVKNHKFIIDILDELRKLDSNTVGVFAGQGELFETIKEEVKQRNLDNNVLFLGLRSDIPDILQAFDVFLLPSLYEGLPVSIVEAQAAGLKCFISDKVPMDCAITNLVEQIKLEAGSKYWATKILESKEYKRKDTFEQIKAAKFEIQENVAYLQTFYLDAINVRSR